MGKVARILLRFFIVLTTIVVTVVCVKFCIVEPFKFFIMNYQGIADVIERFLYFMLGLFILDIAVMAIIGFITAMLILWSMVGEIGK